MTNLTTYIEINHHLMTVKEMSEESGAKDDRIRKICKRNSWTPISEADRIRDLITASQGGIIEDISEKAGCTPANVYKLAKEMGIELVTRKHAEAVSELPAIKAGQKYSLMHHAFNDSDPEGVKEDLSILLGPDHPVKRVKEAYNQSGSPFGLADTVKDIKLK